MIFPQYAKTNNNNPIIESLFILLLLFFPSKFPIITNKFRPGSLLKHFYAIPICYTISKCILNLFIFINQINVILETVKNIWQKFNFWVITLQFFQGVLSEMKISVFDDLIKGFCPDLINNRDNIAPRQIRFKLFNIENTAENMIFQYSFENNNYFKSSVAKFQIIYLYLTNFERNFKIFYLSSTAFLKLISTILKSSNFKTIMENFSKSIRRFFNAICQFCKTLWKFWKLKLSFE